MSLNGKRIFYIEDNAMNSVIVQMIIERHRAKFGFARWIGSNNDILARIRTFMPVDLILLDLMFPLEKVTGYDVFDIIHQDRDFAHIPIAAVSASDSSIEMIKVRAKGFAGYIAKPIHLEHFPNQLTKLIAGEMVWDPG